MRIVERLSCCPLHDNIRCRRPWEKSLKKCYVEFTCIALLILVAIWKLGTQHRWYRSRDLLWITNPSPKITSCMLPMPLSNPLGR